MIRLPQTYYIIKKYLKHYDEISMLYNQQCADNFGKQIQLWNWWDEEKTAYWLQKFIEQQGLLKGSKKTVALCSVFGEREILERVNADVKIFFSGENLHSPRHSQYADYMLSGKKPFNFALGFDEFADERYLRFPLWLTYMFDPVFDKKQIKSRCEQIRYPFSGNKTKFCSLVARADVNGIRTHIYNALNEFDKIDCPSELLHNDDSLKNEFRDDKGAYLMQYKFSICPENSDAYGYCTEKLFDAIAAGCVPVYWGWKTPEPKILNPRAIIFWDEENNGINAIKQIQSLCSDSQQMKEFIQQPRLLPNAEEEILQMMGKLKSQLESLLA